VQIDGAGWVPRTDDPDAVYEALTTWVGEHNLSLYPHQDEAIIELLGGNNVVLATPTGSGKSLVAMAAHAAALAGDRVSFYTAPIKALVSEKFFALCEVFGAENVGMLTGDASVNPDAPIICCTAEVLANIALREGSGADVGLVVMDEFHFYAEPDRGWAWQVPLLELTRTQFVLMSATLGDISELAADLTLRNGRETVIVDDAERPVPLSFSWSMTYLSDTVTELVETHQAPVYVVHFTQMAAVEHATSLLAARGTSFGGNGAADRLPVRCWFRQDPAEARPPRDRRTPRRDAAALPTAGRAARPSWAAGGHLRDRHARGRDQRSDPDSAVHRAREVRWDPAADLARAGVHADRRSGRARWLRHFRVRRRTGPGVRDRQRQGAGQVR
jgi:hypothetical protein